MRRAVKAAAYHERERILKDAAYRDFLTGLLNRRGLEVSLKQLNREDESITVYLFDMDNLKACNDNAGHSCGDLMLKRFGMILKDLTRSDDILARLGGDEFVAVMKSMPSKQVALTKGEKICKAVRESNPPGEPWPLSCSAGVAMMRPGESFEEVIQRADRALYEAKRRGKDQYVIYDDKDASTSQKVPFWGNAIYNQLKKD
jgi:diguanylate cyclase (GGDEF)-like protein